MNDESNAFEHVVKGLVDFREWLLMVHGPRSKKEKPTGSSTLQGPELCVDLLGHPWSTVSFFFNPWLSKILLNSYYPTPAVHVRWRPWPLGPSSSVLLGPKVGIVINVPVNRCECDPRIQSGHNVDPTISCHWDRKVFPLELALPIFHWLV